MVQQRMGDGVGILAGNAVKQRQLQHLHICEIVQTAAKKALLQPLPVSIVNRHGIHLKKSIFVSLFTLAISRDFR